MIPLRVHHRFQTLSQHYRDLRVYALVDGLQYQRHTGARLEPQDDAALALFADTEDAPLAHAGPWLMDPLRAGAYAEPLVELESHDGVLWLIAGLDLTTQAAQLRRLLNVQAPDGATVLLRFWDPRVIGSLYLGLDRATRHAYFGDALEWHFIYRGKRLAINVHDL
jgi:hypothetical protein